MTSGCQAARRAAIPLAAVVPIALAACSSVSDMWFGGNGDESSLPGERISVLMLQRSLEPDPEIATEPVSLPRPLVNTAWPVTGGTPMHAAHHLALGAPLDVAWRQVVGAGETDDNMILSAPIVAADRVFLLDAGSTALAFDLANGSVAWRRQLIPENEEDESSLGGGVAYADGRVYVSTAFGDVFALSAVDGEITWRRNLGAPIRAAPAVSDGRVFATAFDNRLFAIDADDGNILWTHEGITEAAALLGTAVPAVSGDLVVASYSSGEVVAFRVENGRLAWSDSLIFQGRPGARLNLSDVDASPVIDRDLVISVSQSGPLVATELRSGLRVWDREISSVQTPWVAGSYIFVVTTDAEVVCLKRADGRIRWVTQLQRYDDPDDRTGPILWNGPILGGDRLVVTSSEGDAVTISPHTGEVLVQRRLGDGVRVAPVIAGETLYLLTTGAELIALR